MSSAILPSLLITGFAVAFLHTALPTHWLPFALAARARRWGGGMVLAAVTAGALAHTAATAMIGALLTGFGIAAQAWFGGVTAWLAGGFMMLAGGWMSIRALHHRHRHGGRALELGRMSDGSTLFALASLMALSPCEVFLPIYLGDVKLGWAGFAVLTATLGTATFCGMALLVGLSLAGASQFKLERFERYEGLALGLILAGLGVMVIWAEH